MDEIVEAGLLRSYRREPLRTQAGLTLDGWERLCSAQGSGYYFPAHPEQVRPAARGALSAISQGLVDIRTQVFPLAQAAQARRERPGRRPDPAGTLTAR